ncbi:hypothetical protein KIN20_014191 [Parelaphostrongylus tenuis]|uniref:Uncharacterized protein n=1 Tax=Parelaphostrongylus tenuis TaxID=148309 RepID=A0AAD5MZ57_PARTN|nr:hypothetical protein KIN20_014191 [Parelaphostrongylus tenuis]
MDGVNQRKTRNVEEEIWEHVFKSYSTDDSRILLTDPNYLIPAIEDVRLLASIILSGVCLLTRFTTFLTGSDASITNVTEILRNLVPSALHTERLSGFYQTLSSFADILLIWENQDIMAQKYKRNGVDQI